MTLDSLFVLFAVLIAGVALGAGLVAFAGRGKLQAQLEAAVARAEAPLKEQLSESRERARQIESALADERADLAASQAQAQTWRDELDAARDVAAKLQERASRVAALEAELEQAGQRESALRQRSSQLEVQAEGLRTQLQAERTAADEKLKLLTDARQQLTSQLNEVLLQNSTRFAEQNQEALGHLLNPLRTQIADFKGKVEQVYETEGKERSALSEQVRQLVSLNQALSQDAQNLTQALKGNAKAQGNWGELVLERVLEASGLRKGHEYEVQDHQVREDGSRAQPDVVVQLPEDRRLVVDAKVSLIAYEEFVLAESDAERAAALRRHLDSVRGHMKDLSLKKYQALYGIKSLDFVLMFVPIEPAFMAAVTGDGKLFMDAWEKNVLLVSPSTLLFVVRTVAHLWRQEAQNRNAQEIARRGAELYDRLHDFTRELQLVGSRLDQARTSYDDAFRKLAVNKGNVIRQAEMLKDLGVKPSKSLPQPLVDAASAEEDVAGVAKIAVRAAENTPAADPPSPTLN